MPETFDASAVVILVLGGLVLLSAWLPLMVRRLPLSLPIVAVGIGIVAPHGPWMERSSAFLLQERVLEQLVEFVVLVALMGAGLRIERPFGWRRWQATWRLLGVAMPLTIAAMAVLCWAALGLTWAAALLIGAALAPTDPVLASRRAGRPAGEEEGGEVRFALTSEAGLNDGLAFPFVVLAIDPRDHAAAGGLGPLAGWRRRLEDRLQRGDRLCRRPRLRLADLPVATAEAVPHRRRAGRGRRHPDLLRRHRARLRLRLRRRVHRRGDACGRPTAAATSTAPWPSSRSRSSAC